MALFAVMALLVAACDNGSTGAAPSGSAEAEAAVAPKPMDVASATPPNADAPTLPVPALTAADKPAADTGAKSAATAEPKKAEPEAPVAPPTLGTAAPAPTLGTRDQTAPSEPVPIRRPGRTSPGPMAPQTKPTM